MESFAFVTSYVATDGTIKEWSCYAKDVVEAMWMFHYEAPSLGDVRLQMSTVRKDLIGKAKKAV